MKTDTWQEAPSYLEVCLNFIEEVLHDAMKERGIKHYDSPFRNTSNRFECDTFQVRAFDWGWDIESGEPQPINFNYPKGGIQVTWYKWLGRGTCVNRAVTLKECQEMCLDCVESLEKGTELP